MNKNSFLLQSRSISYVTTVFIIFLSDNIRLEMKLEPEPKKGKNGARAMLMLFRKEGQQKKEKVEPEPNLKSFSSATMLMLLRKEGKHFHLALSTYFFLPDLTRPRWTPERPLVCVPDTVVSVSRRGSVLLSAAEIVTRRLLPPMLEVASRFLFSYPTVRIIYRP